jgi:hypothetical protein
LIVCRCAGWKGQLFNCLFDAPLVNAYVDLPKPNIKCTTRADKSYFGAKNSLRLRLSAKVIKRKVFAAAEQQM